MQAVDRYSLSIKINGMKFIQLKNEEDGPLLVVFGMIYLVSFYMHIF